MLEVNQTLRIAKPAEARSGAKELKPLEKVKATVRTLSAKGKKLIADLKIKTDTNPEEALEVTGGGGLQEKNLTQEAVTETKPSEAISKDVARSQTPNVSPLGQAKKELFDQKTISKKHDQEGRNALASDIKAIRKDLENLKKEGAETEEQIKDRQGKLLVRLKQKLNKPDEQLIQLQEKQLEAQSKQKDLPNPREMLKAYYEKMSTEPLSNQEKRDLLKPEVLFELSTDEYVALWKRLNPHFLTHVTRQGLRDHTGGDAMVNHSRGHNSFVEGFIDVMKNEKRIFPPLARIGLKDRDEATVRTFLESYPLQAENEAEALKRFDSALHQSMGAAPTYPDHTSTHLAAQIASDRYYGGETKNEVFFVYPSDVLASQYPFAFNGWEKDFTHPQSETKWNDVFIWTDPKRPGVPVDSGVVFLPKDTKVDPNTGSKYASEIIKSDADDDSTQRIPVEDPLLTSKFEDWANGLNSESPVIKAIEDSNRRNDSSGFDRVLKDEMRKIGVPEDSMESLVYMSGLSQDIFLFKDKHPTKNKYVDDFKSSNAKYKRAENTVTAKEYWEGYFSKHPDQKPKHIIFYNGDPTSAIYKFQQENGIGSADTSKTDGQLLGFDDNHISDMASDLRSNAGHDELVELGNRIITEHYSQEKNS